MKLTRKLLWIVGLLLPLLLPAEPAVLTESAFTAKFFEFLQTELPETEFTVIDDLHLSTKDIHGYELNIYLDNAFHSYLSGTRHADEIYSDQLNAINIQKDAFTNSDVKNILPVIKPGTYLEAARKQLEESGYEDTDLPFHVEKLNEDLYLLYVFDSPESMRFVSPGDVEELGIESSIRDISSTNLQRYFDRVGARLQEIDTRGNGRVFVFQADENYEASILACASCLKRALGSTESEIVVFVPARNLTLIVDSSDSAAIDLASNLAAQAYSEMGYVISPLGYIYSDGRWSRFNP